MDKGHPEGILFNNKPCIQHPTRNPPKTQYCNSRSCAWVCVFPSKCLPQKVPYEVETTGDLGLKVIMISSNQKMMRSTDFLLFCAEKWHPKAFECPWKYAGPDFHRHSQHMLLNGDSKYLVPILWPIHSGSWLLAPNSLQCSMAHAQ